MLPLPSPSAETLRSWSSIFYLCNPAKLGVLPEFGAHFCWFACCVVVVPCLLLLAHPAGKKSVSHEKYCRTSSPPAPLRLGSRWCFACCVDLVSRLVAGSKCTGENYTGHVWEPISESQFSPKLLRSPQSHPRGHPLSSPASILSYTCKTVLVRVVCIEATWSLAAM
jgi:hypothetical protein